MSFVSRFVTRHFHDTNWFAVKVPLREGGQLAIDHCPIVPTWGDLVEGGDSHKNFVSVPVLSFSSLAGGIRGSGWEGCVWVGCCIFDDFKDQ